MATTRMFRICTLATLGWFAAACGNTTAPDVGLDFDDAGADYAALDTMFSTPGWAGFEALGTRTPFGASPAAVDAVASLGLVASPHTGRRFAVELAERLGQEALAGGRPALAPIISDTHRGKTFVYDATTDQYAVDPERTGAPATGVRFIVYAVDDGGVPIVESEIGYADLIDEGDASAEDVALHLVVVAHDATVLDYRTTLELGLTGGALTVDGFLKGETTARLDFSIEAVGTHSLGQSTLDIEFALGVDARGFSITGSVSGVQEGVEGEGDVELTVQHDQHSMQLDVSGSGGEIHGTIRIDGQLFATVDGPAPNPTILSADGDPLTPAEALVLHHIIEVVEDVFDFLEDLVDPVDEIVFLGIIL